MREFACKQILNKHFRNSESGKCLRVKIHIILRDQFYILAYDLLIEKRTFVVR